MSVLFTLFKLNFQMYFKWKTLLKTPFEGNFNKQDQNLNLY